MSQGVTLAKGSFSKDFAEALTDYYQSADTDGSYAERKLQQWEADAGVVLYEAKRESRPVGWVVYRPDSSTIEEIILRKDEPAGEGLEEAIVDALIDQESLVSAEILEEDVEKYRWMLEYGFRPTRHFKEDGLALVKMDLSIAVYLHKIKGKPPAKTYPNVEKVVVERVPPTRSGEELKASLMNVFHSLGGIEKFVKKGQNVVIKANVVADHGLRNGVYQGGVVADVGLVRALIEVLLPVAGKVTVAEGASINRAETDKLFFHYGYDRLTEIDPKRVALVDLNTDSLIRKTVPSGKRMLSREIPLTLEQADVVINLPVMKTHFAALVSLSIKNLLITHGLHQSLRIVNGVKSLLPAYRETYSNSCRYRFGVSHRLDLFFMSFEGGCNWRRVFSLYANHTGSLINHVKHFQVNEPLPYGTYVTRVTNG